MPKLSDTQLIILSAAARHDDGAALPPPTSVKLNDAAVTATLKALLAKQLLVEQPVMPGSVSWRETEGGQRLMLVISDAGRQAIGLLAEQLVDDRTIATRTSADPGHTNRYRPSKTVTRTSNSKSSRAKTRTSKSKPSSSKVRTKQKPKQTTSSTQVRPGTKLAMLVSLLRRKQGAGITELAKATGWQAHSVRGAISGTLNKKLGLKVVSENDDRRGRVYRIKAGN